MGCKPSALPIEQGLKLDKGDGESRVNAVCSRPMKQSFGGSESSSWVPEGYSRISYMLLLGGTPVSWKTKKKSLVSRSSAESEYREMASTVIESKEIILMKISSKMQIADLLTKGLAAQQLQFLLGKIGIANLHAPS
ncbi:hypothetical protein Tco_1084975 [Tanacetum coccineum]